MFYTQSSIVCGVISFFFFFKQKTAYEMRISDWSSDVCSSDLSAVDAFGFFSQPNPFSIHTFTLNLSDGSSVSGDFSGSAGAGFLGWTGAGIDRKSVV